MSTLTPNTVKGLGAAQKQVFQRGGNPPVSRHLFVVPSQRALPLSPGEARRRREAAVINYWLGTRS
jgi:hypothetical protein